MFVALGFLHGSGISSADLLHAVPPEVIKLSQIESSLLDDNGGNNCETECQLHHYKSCEPFYRDHCEVLYKNHCEERYVEKCELEEKHHCENRYEEKCTYEKKQDCKDVFEDRCNPRGNYCRKVPKQSCRLVEVPKCRSIPKTHCVYLKIPQCYKIPEKHCKKVPDQTCHKTKHYKAVKVPYKHCKKQYTFYTFEHKYEYKEDCKKVEIRENPDCETKLKHHCTSQEKLICKKHYKEEVVYENKNHCENQYIEKCPPHFQYRKECSITTLPIRKCKIIQSPKIKRIPYEHCEYVDVPQCNSIGKLYCKKKFKEHCSTIPIKIPFKKKHQICYWPEEKYRKDELHC